MAELSEKLLNLDIAEEMFKDVKYFITGEVHEKITSLLKAGGAEHQNYFSDYVTHLIVGDNPEENDLVDAKDVYEIPAVTPRWIFMCARLKKRLDPNPYFYMTEAKIFSGQIFCFSKLNEDRNNLWGLVTYNGGVVHLKLTGRCSFLVTVITEGPKYDKAFSLGPESIKIVTPDWIFEALKIKGFPDPALFHPKLINWPKPVKPPEPTTAITGFEPDISENAVKVEDKTLPDSTQALLEKLKKRMPWNQPPNSTIAALTTSSDPVAPPNVVAPSFLNRRQQQQQSFKPPVSPIQTSQPAPVASFAPTESQSPNHVPRSIVHHTPNNQPPIQHNININRLMHPQPNRSPTSLQQLRGQLNTSQIHQQLLQQRMQQQTQQNIIQRSSAGPIIINQQLLHQHLSQGQHQALQNLRNQQNLMNQQQHLINQNQNHQGQSPMQVDSQDGLLGQQSQSNNIPFSQPSPITSQANQQNEINLQRNQIERSPSHNQIPSSPQHNQGQLLSPQHQLINQQPSVNQLHQHQQTNQLLNQQQVPNQPQLQNQLNMQQDRNQLLNQQQDRNQLLNQQQDRNQLLNQQQDRSQLLNQQQLIQQQQQNQNNQQLISQQQQIQNELQLLGQQSPQNSQVMQSSPQIIQQNQNQMMQNQQNQQIMQQNQQVVQQNQQMVQQNQQMVLQQNQQPQQLSQQNQGPLIRQTQIISQQAQQLINPTNQHQHNNQQTLLGLPPNHHLSQLNPQQLQQLQQLKREQQQLLNQSQNQLSGINQQTISLNQQNVALSQQNVVNVNQNPQIVSQNQQIPMSQQQLIQNRVIQQQSQQNFNQPGLNQHILNQKQQMFGQQQINTSQHSQQQLIQNLTNQPQFVNQNQFEAIQQQKQQNQLNQMNVQSLNQQLQQQNLGQQLNQQLMQQNQQQGLEQNLGLINQQQQQPQQQQQQQQQQQGLNQQINPVMTQQVIRTQFPQQVLVNQGPQAGPQRAQLGPQIWPPQQQQVGGQIQGQQHIIRHPVNVSVQQSPTQGAVPRIQWPPGQQPQRQLIQLDAHTHNQLQKMAPDQQALFVAKLQQKQRQMQLAKQAQQRASGHILIRGNVPQGLTPAQQVQWLQQQAKQQGIVLPPNIQQNLTPGTVAAQQPQTSAAVPPPQHAPGLSPINQPNAPAQVQQPFVVEQTPQQQLHLKQYRLQQLQREQAHKNALAQQGGIPPQAVVRPPQAQTPAADPPANLQVQVNPKTKTALANMLSIKLQSGGSIGSTVRPEGISEPSAAGTLRMMTAQHNAAINSKPQEIIALHQRRSISGPNGEIIKTPGVSALPAASQADTPKLQFNQKSPVPVQHRVGPFYGHNPNLKLPPDLFLLGCIFVVVEVEDYLEERLPGWQQKIEKYGGEVEKQYCSKVTHVLCETQRHGVVMQALRDLKRCVTIRWLSDIIKRKQVLPPWTALHLPQIYLDLSPASKHLISVSGFEGNLRKIVRQMVMCMGAKCTSYFSKHNTLLICSKAEGPKFDHAKKWGTPVVNVQWLTDIILGNFSAMSQMEHQAYQTYCTPPNFSFDPKLVPNVMHAWKAPINISQESYERVKRSASPVSLPKAKKMKTEHTDENENITDEVFDSNYKILFSQYEPDRVKELGKIVRDLGGIVASDHKEFTHLVVPKLTRSHKLLFAIVKSHYILSDKWLDDSLEAKRFLPESDFGLPTEKFNQTYGTSYEKALQSCNRQQLLDGKTFHVTPSVVPSKRIVCELIELSGGKLERIRRSRAQIEATNATSPLSYFILTAREDLHLVADLLKNKKDKQKVVCNVELVLSSVMKQEFEVEPYAVSVV
ncbi:unnamed protein product [Ceutorhynchus assimilis]|uniref:PAX-interacting protein 1 n=1 Tax=Ceutorhynchus assimilis TaxID=467358 RepID=A0A9P0DJ08_9CUCU|nr:unnamed protein product [Ceutorhynchus assimilis]